MSDIRRATMADAREVEELLVEFCEESSLQDELYGLAGDPMVLTSRVAGNILMGHIDGVVLLVVGKAFLVWGDAGSIQSEQLGRAASGYGVFVRPEFRGQGVASRLIAEAKRLLAQQGFNSVLVGFHEGNAASENMLFKHGFRPVETTMLVRLED